MSSVLPGSLVQCLVTEVRASGANLQVLGFFDGTVETLHLADSSLVVGKKIKARVLYDIPATPPRYALSTLDHIVHFSPLNIEGVSLQERYPIGTILPEVIVDHVDTERGLVIKVDDEINGFVHVSASVIKPQP